MKCENCGQDLRIAKSYMDSPKDTETVTCIQTLVCVNPEYEIYAGKDLNNPRQVARTIRTAMSQEV